MSKVITRFKVYEDDWSLRQHKEPMEFGLEDWLNQLAKKYDKRTGWLSVSVSYGRMA